DISNAPEARKMVARGQRAARPLDPGPNIRALKARADLWAIMVLHFPFPLSPFSGLNLNTCATRGDVLRTRPWLPSAAPPALRLPGSDSSAAHASARNAARWAGSPSSAE